MKAKGAQHGDAVPGWHRNIMRAEKMLAISPASSSRTTRS